MGLDAAKEEEGDVFSKGLSVVFAALFAFWGGVLCLTDVKIWGYVGWRAVMYV